jgi:hypothetical protein
LEKEDRISNILDHIKNYSIRIGERLYIRINKHILFLKHLNKSQNKQAWIEEAILDKLKKEEEQDGIECISREKHLSFKIRSQIDTRIEKRVEFIKKIRGSFSKKQWLLEAIYEKLDTEEEETEKKAKEFLKNMLKETSEHLSK